MPNWIRNKLIIRGKNASQIMKQYISISEEDNDTEYFDFNKIVKCPEELEKTVISSETPKWVYMENERKYGYPDWYTWRCAHWGCKWNSCEFSFEETHDEEIIFYYDTAWKPALEAIRKLSWIHPDLKFETSWSDEDLSYNEGDADFKNGNQTYYYKYDGGSKEAYEHAFELWHNEDEFTFNEELGIYHYKEGYE